MNIVVHVILCPEMCSELEIMRSINLSLVCGLHFMNFSVSLFKCQKSEKETWV